jgi:Rrf2 family protein
MFKHGSSSVLSEGTHAQANASFVPLESPLEIECALLALVYLTWHDAPGKYVRRDGIARALGISSRSANRILTVLRRSGHLWARRGPRGGYRLAKTPESIALADVVRLFVGRSSPAVGRGLRHRPAERLLLPATDDPKSGSACTSV